ncbi:HlyD family efflux transporter periplasmic adaptor subunit [Calditrichota bacterium LG25]
MDKTKIVIQREDIKEALDFNPSWIIKWGNSLILMFILILIFTTWFIKIPSKIKIKITITTQNTPIKIIAHSNGKIIKLFIENNEFVKKNSYLLVIENTANINDIFVLKNQLDEFKKFIANPYNFFDFNSNYKFMLGELQLGELQDDYFNFLHNCLEYKFLIQTNRYKSKKRYIQNKVILLKNLKKDLIFRKDILNNEIKLSQKKFIWNKFFFNKKQITENNLLYSKFVLLNINFLLENLKTNIIITDIEIANYERMLQDLNEEFINKKIKLIFLIRKTFKKLLRHLYMWEQKYILKAPIDGYVIFLKDLNDKQIIKKNDELFAIVPTVENIVGKIYLPKILFDELKIGQKIKIKFKQHPFDHLGIVTGKIESKSLISQENKYLINIKLFHEFKTFYNKIIPYKQGMEINGQIISEDSRLLEVILNRLFYNFRASISK